MQELAAGKLVVKKSRFYAHLYTLTKETDIDDIIKKHQSRYNKANHHCYAMRITTGEQSLSEDFSDDGEVGRPGRVLLQVLDQHYLTNHALVVSRVFGGVKLGVGGVSRAFRTAAEGVVSHYKNPKK